MLVAVLYTQDTSRIRDNTQAASETVHKLHQRFTQAASESVHKLRVDSVTQAASGDSIQAALEARV